jgi:hypothetical protein
MAIASLTIPVHHIILYDRVVTDANGVVDVDADPMATLLAPLEEANHRAGDHLFFTPRFSVELAVTSQGYSRQPLESITVSPALRSEILNSDDYFGSTMSDRGRKHTRKG